MNNPRTPDSGRGLGPGSGPERSAAALDRLGLNNLLQLFLTIIAGAVVAVIAWSIIQRFLHILILLVASFLVAFLVGPLVDRLQRYVKGRGLSIAALYLVFIGLIALLLVLFVPALTLQVQDLLKNLPLLLNNDNGGAQARINQLLRAHGLRLPASIGSTLAGYVSSAGTALLGNTLTIVGGTVQTATDILLVLAIAFYLLLDGRAMHNRAVRLLPAAYRDRWFFIEATIDKVLGGYIRGQLLVALTVGVAAGLGCALLGVQYPIVIGLLAFLFELIPMLGPVLGMIPAVLIALFQSPGLALWVAVYFVVLQQVESNVIVPRVSGHAVGLHPLAALLALLVGVELGGIGAALLAVPLAGILWVIALALYADSTGQSQLLMSRPSRPRRLSYSSVARQVFRRAPGAPDAPGPSRAASASSGSGRERGTGSAAPASGPVALSEPVPVRNERLETIKQEQENLIKQFEQDEGRQIAAENQEAEAPHNDTGLAPRDHPRGPDDTKAPRAI